MLPRRNSYDQLHAISIKQKKENIDIETSDTSRQTIYFLFKHNLLECYLMEFFFSLCEF